MVQVNELHGMFPIQAYPEARLTSRNQHLVSFLSLSARVDTYRGWKLQKASCCMVPIGGDCMYMDAAEQSVDREQDRSCTVVQCLAGTFLVATKQHRDYSVREDVFAWSKPMGVRAG